MTDETGKMAVTATARQRTEDGAVSPDNTDEKQRGRPFEKGTSATQADALGAPAMPRHWHWRSFWTGRLRR